MRHTFLLLPEIWNLNLKNPCSCGLIEVTTFFSLRLAATWVKVWEWQQVAMQFSDRLLHISDRGDYGCSKFQFCP